MSIVAAVLFLSGLVPEPSAEKRAAAERARAAVIAACHIPADRLAIEQDPGSVLFSVALKGSAPLSDKQLDCFATKLAAASDNVALSIEDERVGARYDRLSRRSMVVTARSVLRRQGLLARLPRFDRRRETLAAFAIRLERLCRAAPHSVLRVRDGHLALRHKAPPGDRTFCTVNAGIASGHNPLFVPMIPLPHIDPPPVFLPVPTVSTEKQP